MLPLGHEGRRGDGLRKNFFIPSPVTQPQSYTTPEPPTSTITTSTSYISGSYEP